MATVLASRTNRRRPITFTILLAVTLLLMAFSSNPLVRELQSGLGFAFSPITSTLDGAAGGIASVAGAVAEMDRLRVDNAALRDENDRLKVESALNDEIRRENEQLTALLQLRAGFEHETVAADVISRDSSEFRRVVGIGKGSEDGIAEGDVVIAGGGALVGRVSQVGADSAKSTHAPLYVCSCGRGRSVGNARSAGAPASCVFQ